MSLQGEARRDELDRLARVLASRNRSSGRAARRTPASGRTSRRTRRVASAPMRNAAPARKPTMPSPEASTEQRRRDLVGRRVLAAERPHAARSCRRRDFSTSKTAVFNSSVMFGSRATISSRISVVDQHGVALAVAIDVLDEELVDHAAFAGPAVVVAHVRRRAEDPQPDLAGGVAAQHGPILDQHDLQARPGGRDRAAHARQAAADDGQIGGKRFESLVHVCRTAGTFAWQPTLEIRDKEPRITQDGHGLHAKTGREKTD